MFHKLIQFFDLQIRRDCIILHIKFITARVELTEIFYMADFADITVKFVIGLVILVAATSGSRSGSISQTAASSGPI